MKNIIIIADNHIDRRIVSDGPVPVGTKITAIDSTADWLIAKGKAKLDTQTKPTSTSVKE